MTDPRFAAVTALDQQLSVQAKAEWYRMQLGNLQGSFTQTFLPAIRPALTVAQANAARLGAQSVADITGQPSSIVPAGFAGFASDGRPLPSLLAQPLIQTYVALDNGMSGADAMDIGWDSIDRMLATQVHDSARTAESVQMVEHKVTYYVRKTEPGACGRCLILAGKKYKVNDGFLRHTSCRCYHVPYESTYLDAVDAVGNNIGKGDLVSFGPAAPYAHVNQSPEEIFAAMSEAEQNRAFTNAGAQAIRDGADIYRVVNARYSTPQLGMSTTTDRYGKVYKTTTVGARPGQTRLLPSAIYDVAGDDPIRVHKLLVKNGYILR